MRSVVVLTLIILSNIAFGEITMKSNVAQSNLIELYTSEGCSSCPAADHWLTTLKDHAELWQGVVPIAFHVDYWDYIGWKDRFARAEFTKRQRQYAKENSQRTIYTPGLMSNGKEWRNFTYRPPTTDKGPDVGLLTLNADADEMTISFTPIQSMSNDKLVANVALLGFGLTSDVQRGENRGRILAHDFVVLEMARSSLAYVDGSFRTTALRPESDVTAERYALAVWVSRENEQMPLQAVGAWLDDR